MNYSQIVICGNYGAQNLGDEMILSGLIKYLKVKYINCNITVLSANVRDTKKRHNLRAVKQFPGGLKSLLKYYLKPKAYKETILAVQKADVFILGGGGLFSNLNLKSNYIWANQVKFAKRHNKKMKLWHLGQSLPKLKSFIARHLAKKTYQDSDLMRFRDLDSIKNLRALLPNSSASFKPDFALTAVGSQNIKQKNFSYFRDFALKKDDTSVTVCLRAMNKNKEIKKLLKILNNNQIKEVVFLNFQPRFDQKLHQKVARKLNKDSKIITPKSYKDALTYIEKADLVVTMRLHATIAALNASKNPVVIDYAPKVRQLLNSFKS